MSQIRGGERIRPIIVAASHRAARRLDRVQAFCNPGGFGLRTSEARLDDKDVAITEAEAVAKRLAQVLRSLEDHARVLERHERALAAIIREVHDALIARGRW